MARDTFEFRFDRRGNLVIEDPDLARRLLYLLQRDGKLVVRLETGTPDLPSMPNRLDCLVPPPIPIGDSRIRNGAGCPNMMCDCGALQLVDQKILVAQWNELRDGRGKG